MANNKCCCCDDNNKESKVEHLTLDDGRHAKRVTSFDEDGNEVVEVFAEEKRALKLEKRIIRERKEILAKETHEDVRDGEVIKREILSMEPEAPMQIRERIAVVDHAKMIDNEYVRRDEIAPIVADGVVEGVSALMERMDFYAPAQREPVPIFGAQSIVEKNVAEKSQKESMLTLGLGVVLIAQVAFFAYYLFVA